MYDFMKNKNKKESYFGKPEDMKLKQKPLNSIKNKDFAEVYEYLEKELKK